MTPDRFLELQNYVEGKPMAFEFTKRQIFERALALGIHERMVNAMVKYIWQGQPVGEFLQAVIGNDLFDAAFRADTVNIRLLKQYAMFFHNTAPPDCFGSRKKYKAWLETGGLSKQAMESTNDA